MFLVLAGVVITVFGAAWDSYLTFRYRPEWHFKLAKTLIPLGVVLILIGGVYMLC